MLPDDNGSPVELSVISVSPGEGGKVVGMADAVIGSPVIGSNLNSGKKQWEPDISVATSCPSLMTALGPGRSVGGVGGGGVGVGVPAGRLLFLLSRKSEIPAGGRLSR